MIKTMTWDLVPHPKNVNLIRSMWLHRHKYEGNGKLKKHKSCIITNGKSQEAGIDFNETFIPVVKPTTIRTVLHIGVANNWPIHQLDVQNTFLHGDIEETVYMHQPPGFVSKQHPNHVCKLRKAISRLKQAPKAWNAHFAKFLMKLGFVISRTDTSLFEFRKGAELAYILLYVDDIVLTSSSTTLLNKIIEALKPKFP